MPLHLPLVVRVTIVEPHNIGAGNSGDISAPGSRVGQGDPLPVSAANGESHGHFPRSAQVGRPNRGGEGASRGWSAGNEAGGGIQGQAGRKPGGRKGRGVSAGGNLIGKRIVQISQNLRGTGNYRMRNPGQGQQLIAPIELIGADPGHGAGAEGEGNHVGIVGPARRNPARIRQNQPVGRRGEIQILGVCRAVREDGEGHHRAGSIVGHRGLVQRDTELGSAQIHIARVQGGGHGLDKSASGGVPDPPPPAQNPVGGPCWNVTNGEVKVVQNDGFRPHGCYPKSRPYQQEGQGFGN